MPSSSSTSKTKSTSSKKERTPSFVCEIPLRVTPADEHALNVRLNAARQVYNACLGEALRRAQLLRERRAYQKARRLPKGDERSATFRQARQAVAFSDAALQRYAVRLRQQAFTDHLDVHTTQKLASRAYASANEWLLGHRGRPRFKAYRQLDTVEGKHIRTEKLSYRAFQRQYGSSVRVRAPGMFLSILRRKAESAGGSVVEFPTRTTKLSQVCHGCETYQKKSLSQRLHQCACGVKMQRDLYSAFLARCVGEDNLLHVDTARERWSGAEPLLRAAWSNATQPANGRLRPSSFGVMPRSQSGSSAELGTAHAEARDAVAAAQAAGESPGVVAVVPSEPPGFSRGEAQ